MTEYLTTFLLAIASVGLWTLRVALTARGLRVAGSGLAMVEAVVFVVAFSHVLGALETPVHVVAYGLGVGAGTFIGLSIDGRIGDDRNRKSAATQTEREIRNEETQTATAAAALSAQPRERRR